MKQLVASASSMIPAKVSPFGSWSCNVRKARSERTARPRPIGLNMLHAELRQRPPDLGEAVLATLLAGFRRMKIMTAAIAVERAEQPMPPDRPGVPLKARRRAFFRSQDRRRDGARCVVQGDGEIERRPLRKPGVKRGC